MDVTTLNLYIRPEMGIIVLGLWVLGYIFKKSSFKDELIPVILLVFGIVGACAIEAGISVENIVQGILCCAVSVYGNQLVKQNGKNIIAYNSDIENNFSNLDSDAQFDFDSPEQQFDDSNE